MKNKDIAYYLSLPYPIEVVRIPEEEGGGYNACIPLLGRYAAQGDGESESEAIANLREHLPSLLAAFIADGVDIFEPSSDVEHDEYKGRVLLRIPKSLHAKAARAAKRESVSLNLFLSNVIAEAIGSKKAA